MNAKLFDEVFIDKPYFFWWIEDIKQVSNEAAVEAILNNGNWREVEALIKILGLRKVRTIFQKQISGTRSNYREQTINFFKLFFERHVS